MIVNVNKACLIPSTGLYIQAEVSSESYFDDITISELTITSNSSEDGSCTCTLGEDTELVKVVSLLVPCSELISNGVVSDTDDFNSSIYKVEFSLSGTPSSDTPCDGDLSQVYAYIINDYAIWKASRSFGRNFFRKCSCSLPRKAIDFALSWEFMHTIMNSYDAIANSSSTAFDTLSSWYKTFINRYVKYIAEYTITDCQCDVEATTAVEVLDAYDRTECSCGNGSSQYNYLKAYYDTLRAEGHVDMDILLGNVILALFSDLDAVAKGIERLGAGTRDYLVVESTDLIQDEVYIGSDGDSVTVDVTATGSWTAEYTSS